MAVNRTDYTERAVTAAHSVLLELTRILGEYKDDIVLIGGMVPRFMIPDAEERHIGTLDVTPHELKSDLRNASILKNNRVVFDVCGNKYRIVLLTDYVRHGMLIRFVGTHEEYDEIEDIEQI